MRFSPAKGAVLVAALLAFTVAACGDEVDTADLEKKLATQFEKESGAKADSVSCPDEAKEAKKGSKFDCDIKVEGGGEAKVAVEFVDDDLNFRALFTPAEGAAEEEAPAEGGEEDTGGESGDDEAAITAVIEAVNEDPAALCESATEQVLENLGGPEGCAEEAAAEEPDPIEIESIEVDGDTATVTGTDSDGEQTIQFERAEDGSWLVAG